MGIDRLPSTAENLQPSTHTQAMAMDTGLENEGGSKQDVELSIDTTASIESKNLGKILVAILPMPSWT